MLRYSLGASLVAVVIVACSSGNTTLNGANPDGGLAGTGSPDGSTNGAVDGSTSGSPDASTAVAKVTCVDVLQCAGKCGDNDDVCAQGCVDESSGASHDLAMALYTCIRTNACADSDCTNAKCTKEVDGCLGDVSDPGTTPTGTPPTTGSVPAGLVGTWGSSGTLWTFEADGQTVSALEIDSSLGTCSYKTTVTTSGVTEATADALTYHRQTGTQTFKKCTSTTSTTMSAADVPYRYELGTFDDGSAKLTLHSLNSDGSVSGSTELHH